MDEGILGRKKNTSKGEGGAGWKSWLEPSMVASVGLGQEELEERLEK